jgi:hypothetical protein
MEIKPLEKPRLKPVKMVVDVVIDEKLTKYPAVDCLFANHNFSIFAGLMGQGKSTKVLQLLSSVFKKCFEHVYVVIPEISLHSIEEKSNVYKKYLDDGEHLFYEYTPEILEGIYGKLLANSEEGLNSLLIIDDFGSEFKSNRECERLLNKIIIKMRHLRCTVFLLAQGITQLPLKWRQMATNLIMFNLGKSQLERVFNETIQLTQDQFDKVCTLYQLPHDCIMMSLRHRRMFKDFDEIILREDIKGRR